MAESKHGKVAERPNATDCKSVDYVFDGSNPSLPTIAQANDKSTSYGSVVQLVRTLACHARGRGFKSHPSRQVDLSCFPFLFGNKQNNTNYALIAQSVEQRTESEGSQNAWHFGKRRKRAPNRAFASSKASTSTIFEAVSVVRFHTTAK